MKCRFGLIKKKADAIKFGETVVIMAQGYKL